MTDVLRAAKRAAKAAKNSMICSLCNQLDKARKANNGSIPYGALTKLVLKAKEAAPDLQITRYDIDNYRRKLEAEKRNVVPAALEEESNDPEETAAAVLDQRQMSSFRALGGRPKGATMEARHISKDSIIAACNEIATKLCRRKEKGQ